MVLQLWIGNPALQMTSLLWILHDFEGMANKIPFEMEMESVVRVAYSRACSPEKKLMTIQTTLFFFFLIGVGFFCWIKVRVYLKVNFQF